MEGFGIEKLALILVIVLIMFGAKRIPEISASLGKGIREFKRSVNDVTGDAGATVGDPLRQRPNVVSDPGDSDARPEPKRLLGNNASDAT